MMTRKHAKCTICYEDPTAGKLIQSEMAALEPRIKGLYGGRQDRTTYRFSKSMAYKMVQSLAQFDPSCQAVTEIILDSNRMECTSQVNFANCTIAGDFQKKSVYINSLSESGAFVMNCKDDANLEKEIFINHGWNSFHIFENFLQKGRIRHMSRCRKQRTKCGKGMSWFCLITILLPNLEQLC